MKASLSLALGFFLALQASGSVPERKGLNRIELGRAHEIGLALGLKSFVYLLLEEPPRPRSALAKGRHFQVRSEVANAAANLFYPISKGIVDWDLRHALQDAVKEIRSMKRQIEGAQPDDWLGILETQNTLLLRAAGYFEKAGFEPQPIDTFSEYGWVLGHAVSARALASTVSGEGASYYWGHDFYVRASMAQAISRAIAEQLKLVENRVLRTLMSDLAVDLLTVSDPGKTLEQDYDRMKAGGESAIHIDVWMQAEFRLSTGLKRIADRMETLLGLVKQAPLGPCSLALGIVPRIEITD